MDIRSFDKFSGVGGKNPRLCLLWAVCLCVSLCSCASIFVGNYRGAESRIVLDGASDRCVFWREYFCRANTHIETEGSGHVFTLVMWVASGKVRIDVISRWGGTVAVGIFDNEGDNFVWLPSRKEVYLSKEGSRLMKYLLGVEFPPRVIAELISGCGVHVDESGESDKLEKVILKYNEKIVVEYDPPLSISDPEVYPRHMAIRTAEGVIKLNLQVVERQKIDTEVYRLSFPGDVKLLRL